jgi:hypothetical protein
MNTCYVVRSSRPAGLFSFSLLDGLPVRLRRPYLREAQAGFGLECLATAFTNNPGYPLHVHSDTYRISDGDAQYEILVLHRRVCKDLMQ